MNNRILIKTELSEDTPKTPIRVAYIKPDTSLAVERERDEEVMTFPHLIIREILAFEILMITLAIIALIFDAPLEEIANPQHSPNPAKAPWYFLGLQELLHYFPPVVAGVILPAMVVIALVVIPYFRINYTKEPFWRGNIRRKAILLTTATFAANVPFMLFHALPIYLCSMVIYVIMTLPLSTSRKQGILAWLGRLALADWIMVWFILIATILTLIGILFRGPEWNWTWPWIDGIY